MPWETHEKVVIFVKSSLSNDAQTVFQVCATSFWLRQFREALKTALEILNWGSRAGGGAQFNLASWEAWPASLTSGLGLGTVTVQQSWAQFHFIQCPTPSLLHEILQQGKTDPLDWNGIHAEWAQALGRSHQLSHKHTWIYTLNIWSMYLDLYSGLKISEYQVWA